MSFEPLTHKPESTNNKTTELEDEEDFENNQFDPENLLDDKKEYGMNTNITTQISEDNDIQFNKLFAEHEKKSKELNSEIRKYNDLFTQFNNKTDKTKKEYKYAKEKLEDIYRTEGERVKNFEKQNAKLEIELRNQKQEHSDKQKFMGIKGNAQQNHFSAETRKIQQSAQKEEQNIQREYQEKQQTDQRKKQKRNPLALGQALLKEQMRYEIEWMKQWKQSLMAINQKLSENVMQANEIKKQQIKSTEKNIKDRNKAISDTYKNVEKEEKKATSTESKIVSEYNKNSQEFNKKVKESMNRYNSISKAIEKINNQMYKFEDKKKEEIERSSQKEKSESIPLVAEFKNAETIHNPSSTPSTDLEINSHILG